MSQRPEALLAQIDRCENGLLAVLDQPPAARAWDEWRQALDRLRDACVGEDAPLTVLADELQVLACAIAPEEIGEPPPPPPTDPRFGYGVLPSSKANHVVVPSFAWCVARLKGDPAIDIAQEIPELSLADFELWSYLSSPTSTREPRSLIRNWLASPARRLAWDLSTLERVGSAPSSAADLSNERVLAAVGAFDAVRAPTGGDHWPSLYESTPWPAVYLDLNRDELVVRALRALDSPTRLWDRSRAIELLLARADTDPEYRVGDLRRDLREELPARIAAMMEIPADEVLIALEQELLRIAVTIRPDDFDGRPTFAIARWLGYVLRRSPLHRGDLAVLSARLHGIRRDSTALVPRERDTALHPRRLLAMLTDTASWRDFVIVVGSAAHYLVHSDQDQSLPLPVSLEKRLHKIAQGVSSEAEREQESSLAARPETAVQPYSHAATTWIARATLHRARSVWLTAASEGTFAEILATLLASPPRYEWMIDAISLAGPWLPDGVRRRCAEAWRNLTPTALPMHRAAQLGAVAVSHLTDEERQTLAQQCMNAPLEWRPFVLDAVVAIARQTSLPSVEARFIELLGGVAEDREAATEVRQRALALWLRRLSTRVELRTAPTLDRLRALVQHPMVQNNSALRREFERLGVRTQETSGGSR